MGLLRFYLSQALTDGWIRDRINKSDEINHRN